MADEKGSSFDRRPSEGNSPQSVQYVNGKEFPNKKADWKDNFHTEKGGLPVPGENPLKGKAYSQ